MVQYKQCDSPGSDVLSLMFFKVSQNVAIESLFNAFSAKYKHKTSILSLQGGSLAVLRTNKHADEKVFPPVVRPPVSAVISKSQSLHFSVPNVPFINIACGSQLRVNY